jgi:hypothetical protein
MASTDLQRHQRRQHRLSGYIAAPLGPPCRDPSREHASPLARIGGSTIPKHGEHVCLHCNIVPLQHGRKSSGPTPRAPPLPSSPKAHTRQASAALLQQPLGHMQARVRIGHGGEREGAVRLPQRM